PALQRRHIGLRERWLRRPRAVVMLPAFVPIGDEDVVENHGAEAHHDQFSDIADEQGRIKTIGFKTLPPGALFITERKHVLAEDVAKKPKFKALMHGIGRQNHAVVTLEKEDLASPGM